MCVCLLAEPTGRVCVVMFGFIFVKVQKLNWTLKTPRSLIRRPEVAGQVWFVFEIFTVPQMMDQSWTRVFAASGLIRTTTACYQPGPQTDSDALWVSRDVSCEVRLCWFKCLMTFDLWSRSDESGCDIGGDMNVFLLISLMTTSLLLRLFLLSVFQTNLMVVIKSSLSAEVEPNTVSTLFKGSFSFPQLLDWNSSSVQLRKKPQTWQCLLIHVHVLKRGFPSGWVEISLIWHSVFIHQWLLVGLQEILIWDVSCCFTVRTEAALRRRFSLKQLTLQRNSQLTCCIYLAFLRKRAAF